MSNVLELFKLDNQVAIVTGCNRGIGMAMATALAEAGADIIGVSRTLEPNSEVEKIVLERGRKFFAYTCDFKNRDSVYEFVNKINADFETINILVNNAGTIKRAPIVEHTDEYWDEVIAINQTAQFILAREIGKKMLLHGKGKIIFTASLLSFQGGITVPGYAASKGAINSMIKAFANEWAAKRINVNGIAPGYIATDNTEALRNDADRSKSILLRVPADRWGEAEDLKGAVVYLASSASDYVHGSIITVDGGWMGR